MYRNILSDSPQSMIRQIIGKYAAASDDTLFSSLLLIVLLFLLLIIVAVAAFVFVVTFAGGGGVHTIKYAILSVNCGMGCIYTRLGTTVIR